MDIRELVISLSLKNLSGQEKNLVYCALNPKNEKLYVGMTTSTLSRRKSSHKNSSKSSKHYFYEAIRKYGFHSFEWYVLFVSESTKEVLFKETEFIQKFATNNRRTGYNLTTGGESPVFSDETKRKIGLANKGKLAGEKNGFFGRKHSDETRAHLSRLRKGIKPKNGFIKHSEETKKVLSQHRKEWSSKPENKRLLSLQNQHRKRLYCVELDKEFESIKEAAAFFKVGYQGFKNHIRRNQSYNSFSFKIIPPNESLGRQNNA